jgi:hypothetical protein
MPASVSFPALIFFVTLLFVDLKLCHHAVVEGSRNHQEGQLARALSVFALLQATYTLYAVVAAIMMATRLTALQVFWATSKLCCASDRPATLSATKSKRIVLSMVIKILACTWFGIVVVQEEEQRCRGGCHDRLDDQQVVCMDYG